MTRVLPKTRQATFGLGRWCHRLRLLMLIGLLLSGTTLAAILVVGARTDPQAADVIIVLGARVYPDRLSTALKERLDTALQIYQDGLASQLIVSGAQGPDEPMAEAHAMRDYLVARGISSQSIQLDERSYSTVENLRNSLVIMRQSGFGNAVVVTSDYHVLRVDLIARQLGLPCSTAAAPLPVTAWVRCWMLAREVVALWKELLTLPWIGR